LLDNPKTIERLGLLSQLFLVKLMIIQDMNVLTLN